MEPEPYVWAIYVSSFAAVGRNKGYNQLYLIQLGEARKLGNRNERRREGKRWATLPPTVSDTVGFGFTFPMCFFVCCHGNVIFEFVGIYGVSCMCFHKTL